MNLTFNWPTYGTKATILQTSKQRLVRAIQTSQANLVRSIGCILVLLISQKVLAQKTIEGLVRDADGPLVGAAIEVKNSKTYAIADSVGHFELQVPSESVNILLVRLVGYKPQEIVITQQTITPMTIYLVSDNPLSEIVVTSRRRKESVQDIPIPITVLAGELVAQSGSFNVNRLKELVPSVQLYSSNPRNTGINIRGMGSTFGLTNDGIEPGVGFYIDGVYFSRPAVATLDFIDIQQIEVLRGPQGTLFGKNTTAGAFNITTKRPSFTSGSMFEISYGNFGFVQAKASITGPLSKKVAARLSFSGTQREGLLENVATSKKVNTLNNLGFRGQLLYNVNSKLKVLLAGDYTRQRPDGYAQVIAGVAPTLRPEYRQFNKIIADLGYELPSRNAFDRKIDHDSPWKSGNDLGSASINVDYILGNGTLTSTTAFTYWNWDPSNDRDFTGLQVLKLSQATSKHQQWSQEVRWAGKLRSNINGVIGVFALHQNLNSNPFHIEESGNAQWRFSQNSTSALWQTPGLFDGFGIKTDQSLTTTSVAGFTQIDWRINKRLSVLPGLRYNYDNKQVDFSRTTYGGLQTTDSLLLDLKSRVYTNQSFKAAVDNTNFSGQLTVAYKASSKINIFATYANSYKPVGLNLGGLPTSGGKPLLELAVIKPEQINHYELGIKTSPTLNSTINFTVFNSDINDYQTLVQSPELGVNRGYLANAEKVQVRGFELDANIKFAKFISLYGGMVYNEGKYVAFTNAPLPLEETGFTVDGKQVAFKDISGSRLPGISKWAGSVGIEFNKEARFLANPGNLFVAFDTYYRSEFSSSPSPSTYLNVEGYSLSNIRFGFKTSAGTSVFAWSRNLFNKNYYEQLLPGAGNAGHFAGVLGDPRTFGITIQRML